MCVLRIEPDNWCEKIFALIINLPINLCTVYFYFVVIVLEKELILLKISLILCCYVSFVVSLIKFEYFYRIHTGDLPLGCPSKRFAG